MANPLSPPPQGTPVLGAGGAGGLQSPPMGGLGGLAGGQSVVGGGLNIAMGLAAGGGLDLEEVLQRVKDLIKENEELGEMVLETGKIGEEWTRALEGGSMVLLLPVGCDDMLTCHRFKTSDHLLRVSLVVRVMSFKGLTLYIARIFLITSQ